MGHYLDDYIINQQTVSATNATIQGSFENEALENEDRSPKHPKLENEAPKTRKRSSQISKTKHPRSKTKHPKSRKRSTLNLRKRSTQNSKTKHPRSKTKHPISKTKHPRSKTKTPKSRKRSTQISKTKYPELETTVGCTSCMTQSESGGGSGCVRTSKGPQNPPQGFIRACQLFN